MFPDCGAGLLLSALCFTSPKASELVSGTPVAVIRDGVIDQDTLRELRFSMSDLMESLRGRTF